MRGWVPRYCVWELTLACNAKCKHCGSAAGRARDRELGTDEALALVGELAALGCLSVTLSGGEPLLRPDWPEVCGAIRQANMRAELITNGSLAAEQADVIAEAGFFGVTFSIDGPAEIHDALRGVPGGLQALLDGAEALRCRGVRIGAATQINRHNVHELEAIRSLLVAHGFQGWQLQLTMPLGRAGARGAALCLAPDELPALESAVVDLCMRPGLFTQAADNLGYMSRTEPILRSGTGKSTRVWTGCAAGLEVVGLTSDGTVRGCLSLPPEADEGNVRDRGLTAIWQDPTAFAYNRRFAVSKLTGACAKCPFGRVCRAGCHSLAWSASGNPYENPYCLHGVQTARTDHHQP